MNDNRDSAVQVPHDLMNEQILLAAAMADAGARRLVLQRVRPEQMLDEVHSVALAAVQRADDQGLEPSPATLAQLSGGRLDVAYLTELAAAHPRAPPNLRHHVEALHWDAARAKAVQGPLAELLRALQDPGTPPERVRALAAQVPQTLVGGGSRAFLCDGVQVARDQAALVAGRVTGTACYPFGIEGLDRYGDSDVDESGASLRGMPLMVPGLEPGLVTTVTSVSGGGKSCLSNLVALEVARLGRPVLYGAWEEGPGRVLERMGCISAGISRSRCKAGKLTPAEVRLLRDRMDSIAQCVRFMKMPFGKRRGGRHNHDEVLDEIHGYIADSGCDIAFFDLWRRAFRGLDPQDEEEALYRQQAIAEETQCHVVLVQQQRLKDVEKRSNPVPTREGIKGSSAWVDVSDNILGVYIPSLFKQVAGSIIELHVLKQRDGRWPLRLEFKWNGDLVRLLDGRLVAMMPGNEDSLGGSSLGRKWLRK